jgi:hypothetical protein
MDAVLPNVLLELALMKPSEEDGFDKKTMEMR